MAEQKIKATLTFNPEVISSGSLLSTVRAVKGVVSVRNKKVNPKKDALIIKVEGNVFKDGYTEKAEKYIIKSIEDISGVYSLQVFESPFVKQEKKDFDPTPQTPQD